MALLALALAGHGVRWFRARSGGPSGSGPATVLPAAGQEALRAQRDRVARLLRPLKPGDRIDLDRAQVPELTRLPRIGPVLARAIVSDRERNGPFGGVEALDRVAGIGPALVAAIAPYAAFSAPAATRPGPGLGPGSGSDLVDINRATRQELQALPGIGPTRAGRVIAYRELHGPFASLESLEKVAGIGKGITDRLRDLVRFR